MGKKRWVRGYDNSKAAKLKDRGGNRQQEMGGGRTRENAFTVFDPPGVEGGT